MVELKIAERPERDLPEKQIDEIKLTQQIIYHNLSIL